MQPKSGRIAEMTMFMHSKTKELFPYSTRTWQHKVQRVLRGPTPPQERDCNTINVIRAKAVGEDVTNVRVSSSVSRGRVPPPSITVSWPQKETAHQAKASATMRTTHRQRRHGRTSRRRAGTTGKRDRGKQEASRKRKKGGGKTGEKAAKPVRTDSSRNTSNPGVSHGREQCRCSSCQSKQTSILQRVAGVSKPQPPAWSRETALPCLERSIPP